MRGKKVWRMPKKALIAGATGLIGEQLLQLLLDSNSYEEIVVLSRKEISNQNKRIRVVVIDFEDLPADASFWQTNDIFCCLGTTMKKVGSKEAFKKVDYEYPKEIARLCYKRGAESYHLISALGADSDSSIFYNKVKGETEEAIERIGFSRFHVYRPSLLFGDRKEFRLGERVGIYFAKAISFLMLGPLKKYRGIDSAKVAKAMITNAQKNEPGKFVHESQEMQNYQV